MAEATGLSPEPGAPALARAPDGRRTLAWVLGYTAVIAGLSILRYRLWLATGWDLGVFEQDMWLALHRGLGAVSTFTGHPFLADAASYVLVLLAPLYAAGGPASLLLLQAFCLGLGYWFLRRIGEALGVPPRAAHALGVLYLLDPTVLGTSLFDFHPDVLGVPLLFGAIWAALRRRPLAFAGFALAAILVKDTVPLLLAALGLALLLQRRWLWGAATVAAAAGAELLDVHVVIRGLMHGAPMVQWVGLYSRLGPTPAAGLAHLLWDPLALLSWTHRRRAWEYVAWMLGPLVPALAAGPARLLNAWWLPALALMEANLLSPAPVMTDPFNQLTVLAVPFLFAAAAAALAAPRRGAAGGDAPRWPWFALPGVLLGVFAWHEYRTAWRPLPQDPGALRAALRVVPAAAPLVAPNFVAPHAADRPQLWLAGWPLPALRPGTYVLLVAGPAPGGVGSEAALARLERAVTAPGAARRRFAEGGVVVYRVERPLPPTAGA
jgi:hypothetical protein